MVALTLFALIAGAGTAITPCVLPVLPAMLSASATGGRRRPVGIVIGLVTTFTVTIVGLAKVVEGVGSSSGVLRSLAIAVLLVFGLALLVPALGDRIEAPLSRLARFGPKSSGDGFVSGLGVGAALGFVCAPCAGPILAAVISVSASQGTSLKLVVIAFAYSAGLGAVLLLYALGGRRATERVRAAGRGPVLQRSLGAVLMMTGVLMAFSLDIRFESALANHVPSFLVNPTKSIERSSVVEKRLRGLRGKPKFDSAAGNAPAPRPGTPVPAAETPPLPDLGQAPDFTNTQRWFNTPGGRPLSLAGLRGKVVFIDFWTYTCINCIRTLPFVRGLDASYRRDGLVVVGVHTPEFGFERDAGNVAQAIRADGLHYPVVQDNAYGTWNAYGNQYWPANYLIDATGHVRYTHFGEGDEDQIEAATRALLVESGAKRLAPGNGVRGEEPSTDLATPETYLGAGRAQGFTTPPRRGTHTYPGPRGAPALSRFTLGGTWNATAEDATAVRDATLDVTFQAAHVYLVLSSRGGAPRPVRVSVDGRPAGAGVGGRDARDGLVTVRGQRLYELVSLPRAGRHRLSLRLAPGITGYAFTFG